MVYDLEKRLKSCVEAIERACHHVEGLSGEEVDNGNSDRIMNWNVAALCELEQIIKEVDEEEFKEANDGLSRKDAEAMMDGTYVEPSPPPPPPPPPPRKVNPSGKKEPFGEPVPNIAPKERECTPEEKEHWSMPEPEPIEGGLLLDLPNIPSGKNKRLWSIEKRDPNRIHPMLRVLQRVWAQNPGLRLGQIVNNCAGKKDAYYVEDDEMYKNMEIYPGKGLTDHDDSV